MERMIAFDPRTKKLDYLIAPPQPDGIPLLAYAWTDGTDFAATGTLLQLESPGVASTKPGPWIVVQNKPVGGRANI
jgi:hypothetical protein